METPSRQNNTLFREWEYRLCWTAFNRLKGPVGSTEYIVMRSTRLNPYMVYLHTRTDGFRAISHQQHERQ